MDKVNQKMRKFNLRGVLENLRSSVQDRGTKVDACIEETLRSEHFQIIKTARHGFPYRPTAIAYDPVQNLLAVGTKSGNLRIFGRPGVECDIKHEAGFAVVQLVFLINEGAFCRYVLTILFTCGLYGRRNLNLFTRSNFRERGLHTVTYRFKVNGCTLELNEGTFTLLISSHSHSLVMLLIGTKLWN